MSPSNNRSVRKGTFGLEDRPRADFHPRHDVGTIDDPSLQSLITTAILATTAFRLRDQDGLTEALRRLARAVRPFEADPVEE
ncbi:MAG: hypothetical protein ACR2RA_01185 [Geminicoccaceae bacterium]